MLIKLKEKINLPAWAVYHLTYGEDDSLSAEGLNLIERFTIDKENLFLDVKSEDEFFSDLPEFGLPCNCVESDIYINSERVCIDYFPTKTT